jgi:outer membrane immunogenic protein
MEKVFVTAIAFTALTSASLAADLPARTAAAPPMMARPAFSWTGFYIGVNAGGAFSTKGDAKTVGSPAFVSLEPLGLAPASLGTSSSSFIGGGQAGYNFQSGSIVYGVEADLDWLNQKKTAGFTSAATVLGTTLTTTATHNLDYLGTVRARLGVTPVDRLLVFATGGFAYGGVKDSGSVVANAAPAINWNGSSSTTAVGFAVGAGAEYAFTDNISFKAEYLYYSLGSHTNAALGNAAVRAIPALNGVYYVSKTETAGSAIRAGINYKF